MYTLKGKKPIPLMASQEEAIPSWAKVILEKEETLSLRTEEQSQRTSIGNPIWIVILDGMISLKI